MGYIKDTGTSNRRIVKKKPQAKKAPRPATIPTLPGSKPGKLTKELQRQDSHKRYVEQLRANPVTRDMLPVIRPTPKKKKQGFFENVADTASNLVHAVSKATEGVGSRPDIKEYQVKGSRTKMVNGHKFYWSNDRDGWVTFDKNGKARGMTIGEANPDRLKKQAAFAAPVIKVMEQTTRPLHATAGAIDYAVRGKNPLTGAVRGITHKEKIGFGKVLKDVGAPKIVQKVGGGVLDVAGDPTTYATLGTGAVAKKGIEKATEGVAKKATKAGMSEAGKEAVVKAAAKRAAKKAPEGKGLTVSFAGHEVPGVRRATGAAARGVKKAGERVPVAGRVDAGVRRVVGEVRPSLRQAGVDEAQHVAGRQANRRARATVNKKARDAQSEAVDIRKRIPPDKLAYVIAQIERGPRAVRKIKDPELRKAAQDYQANLRGQHRQRLQSGVAQGHIGGTKRITVPKVTADTAASRKAADAAVAARAKLERSHRSQVEKAGMARGRAELLAEREARKRGGAPGAQTTPKRTLAKLERERGKLTAMEEGGALTRARRAAKEAQEAHEATVKLARVQRSARVRAEKAKQAAAGEAKGYVPHAREDILKAGQGAHSRPQSGSGIQGSTRRREVRTPIDVQNAARPEGRRMSTDLPLVHENYTRQTGKGVARANLVTELAAAGRTVKVTTRNVMTKNGKLKIQRNVLASPLKLKEGEGLYFVGTKGGRYDLHEVERAAIETAQEKGRLPGKGGKYVVLNKQVVDRARTTGGSVVSEHTLVRGFDRATRGFKRVATATPGFHVRNFIGDTQLAYFAQPGHRLPVTMAQATKGVKAASKAETKHGLGKPLTSDATIKVGGRRVPMDDFLREAEKEGVIRSGYIGRELEDLVGGAEAAGVKAKGAIRRGGRRIADRTKRWMQNREDLQRLATYKHFRDQGMKPGDAADKALEAHIDYGDLTKFEKTVMRRAAPFYTFTARALPFQAKTLVTRPGKIANIEKIREAAGSSLGLADYGNSGFSEYKQRQIPIPVKINGKVYGLSAGLPLNLLNELPAGTNPQKYLEELFHFGGSLANPVFKNPVEYFNNYSFFFRDQIERDSAPTVAAPSWVALLPENAKKAMGVVPDFVDKQTGKKTWGWNGRADYLVKQFPGMFNIGQQLATEGSDRQGKGLVGKAISALTGIKSDPWDPESTQIGVLYTKSNEIAKKLAGLRQRGFSAKNPNAEYRKLLLDQKILDAQINGLSVKRGDKVPLKRKPGRKAAAPKSLYDSGQSSGDSLYDSLEGANQDSLYDALSSG